MIWSVSAAVTMRAVSSCCEQMGDTVLVDPYDCKRLETELGMGFEQLMQSCVGLPVEEGLIVPHLKMQEQTDTLCIFK